MHVINIPIVIGKRKIILRPLDWIEFKDSEKREVSPIANSGENTYE